MVKRKNRTEAEPVLAADKAGPGSEPGPAPQEADEEDDGLTEYEQRRLAQIRRNQERMREVMGEEFVEPIGGAAGGAKKRGGANKSRSKAAPRSPVADGADVRRSGRVRKQPAVIYTTFEENDDLGNAAPRKGTGSRGPWLGGGDSAGSEGEGERGRYETRPPAALAKAASGPAAPAPAGSIKGIQVDVEGLIKAHLGREMLPPPGSGSHKASVMAAIAGRSPASPPTFNKYSGIQDFKNCVALFVNHDGNFYKNALSDGGRTIRWFAQPTQTLETPVIQAMLATMEEAGEGAAHEPAGAAAAAAAAAAGPGPVKEKGAKEEADEGGGRTEAEAGPSGSGENRPGAAQKSVLLFMRPEGLPYVFCGRLRCVRYSAQRQPIELVFQLVDYEHKDVGGAGRPFRRFMGEKVGEAGGKDEGTET